MICDKCVKKPVCKLCDGQEIKGCIEFYRPHEDILKDIRQELEDIRPDYGDGTGWEQGRRFSINEALKIIDKHLAKGEAE